MSKSKCQKGGAGYVALVVTLLTMIISLTVIGGFTFFAAQEVHTNTAFTKSIESRYIAEGGIEDMVYRVIFPKKYPASETLVVGSGTTALTVSTSGNQKTIRSEGTRDNIHQNLETKITITTDAVNFFYGVQIGDGGLVMDGGSQVTGNVYSDGSIVAGIGAAKTITGNAVVATGLPATPDPDIFTNNGDQTFATDSSNEDIAQSFIAPVSGALGKASIYLRKNGSPNKDITLRLVSDNAGNPNTTSIANTTILRSSVGTSLSWIDASFSPAPNLTANTKYWLVLNYGDKDAVKNWTWGKTADDMAYLNNTGKYTGNWATGPWTAINADLDFRAWIGGIETKIDGITIGGVGHANKYMNGTTASGVACPDATYCAVEYPARQEMPISDGVILDWKKDANPDGSYFHSGDYDVNGDTTLGRIEIEGNLVFNAAGTVTIAGTVYVHGSIDFSHPGITIKCALAYGTNSCLLLTDSWIHVKNGATFSGSGQSAKSFIMLLSTLACTGSSGPGCDSGASYGAIEVDNNADAVIFYTSKGLLTLYNNVGVQEATGYKIHLNNGANVTYVSGLADAQFSSGPSGGYSVDTWQQVP